MMTAVRSISSRLHRPWLMEMNLAVTYHQPETIYRDYSMLDITKESLTELGMRLQFHATEASNGFFFARTTWATPRAPEYGYAGMERWLSDTYAHFCYHIAPVPQEDMWNSNEFGVVLLRSLAQKAMPVLADDMEETPF